MDIDVVRPSQLSADDRAAWSALQRTSREYDSPFLSPGWAEAVEAAEGADSPSRVAIFRKEGRPCAFFPVSIPFHTGKPLGHPMCDYQAVVAEPGVTVDVQALIDVLGVTRFDFANMLRSQQAFVPHIKGTLPAYSADLSHGYERYVRDMGDGSGILGELQGLREDIEKSVGPLKYRALSRCRADLDQLIAWRDEPMEPWAERLIDSLFASRDTGFGGGLYTLHSGDKLIAAQFYLRGEKTLHAWLCAHDRALDRFWPGLLLSAGIMRWMDDKPYETIDFGVSGAFTGRQLCNVVRNVGIGAVVHASPANLLRGAADKLRAAVGLPSLQDQAAAPAKARRIGGLR